MTGYQAPIPPFGEPHPAAPQDRVRTAPRPTPTVPPATTSRQHVVLPRRKSVLLAGTLALFLGPVGLAYASLPGAAITAALVLFVGLPVALVFPPWMYVAALLVTPVCVVWGVSAALAHNMGRQALLLTARAPRPAPRAPRHSPVQIP
ncbi:hypothetical protein [Mobilicoccus pelagius]|uniref:Uncharacterized protein n=1 Tax=Mobilicoccus pelagius NBRC 104925 TaxID=1089455 RepID=H5UW08_9MICO|nr:hypothetical protein [Mobilicoccus pelagius]GAB49916.1 hypothetical protein MOPEL_135_01540 [Mobilicoccus pelagius NBRC 104925]